MVSIVDFQEKVGSGIWPGRRSESRSTEDAPDATPNARLSSKLLLAAFLIEGGAIATNLMASMLNIGQYYDAGQAVFHNIPAVMAAVPFIIMAMVEFSKIPLAVALLNTRWFWRPLIAIALIGMSAITFETLVMGLERASSLQSRKIEAVRIEISDTQARMMGDKDEKEALKIQRDTLTTEIQKLNEQERTETALLDARFNNALEAVNQRRRALEEQIARNRDAEREALKMHTQRALSVKGGVSAKASTEIADKAAAERSSIQVELARIKDPIDLTSERQALKARFAQQRAPIEEQLRGLPHPALAVDADLRHDLNRKNVELATLINENQLYRLTASFYGHDNVSDVTKEEIKTVGGLWFSTIAALGAFAGPVLSLSSVAVTRIRPKRQVSRAGTMFYNALRTVLIRLRRRARIQVIKEVPVEVPGPPQIIKVIEEIEIPVEKIVEVERVVEKLVKVIEPIPMFREDSLDHPHSINLSK